MKSSYQSSHVLWRRTLDADFWHRRWQTADIAFHQSDVNSLLAKHLGALHLKANDRLFLPLCGKTLDIAWLRDQGYQVVGIDLSEIAISQLFDELNLTPHIRTIEGITHYSSTGIDMFVGDFFSLTHQILGKVEAVYDRAALVALPLEMRKRYTSHLIQLTQCAPQLLITFEYDQQQLEGPPFSISDEEIRQHYLNHYALLLLDKIDVKGGLKQRCAAEEKIWLLT